MSDAHPASVFVMPAPDHTPALDVRDFLVMPKLTSSLRVLAFWNSLKGRIREGSFYPTEHGSLSRAFPILSVKIETDPANHGSGES